jgi:hypothetical protein
MPRQVIWHAIAGIFSMKRISLILIAIAGYIQAFSQQPPPVNDTLIPKQHLDDTIPYEPKLQGGALIDTINIKDKSDYHPGYLKDTLKEKNSGVKPKREY